MNTADKSLIRAGDTVYLRCIVKANPLVHTITWFYQVIHPNTFLPFKLTQKFEDFNPNLMKSQQQACHTLLFTFKIKFQ